jgi:molecular chaperone GrpE
MTQIMKKTKQTQKLDKKDQVKKLQLELEESNAQKLRALADYQNLVKRTQVEKAEWIKFANTNLLIKLITIADNLEKAANHLDDPGLNMIKDEMQKLLAEFEVAKIEAEGQEFDPACMDCVDKAEGEEEIVLKVSQSGYKMADKVLRPAKVIVGQSLKNQN